jgi:hypothetical protein
MQASILTWTNKIQQMAKTVTVQASSAYGSANRQIIFGRELSRNQKERREQLACACASMFP